MFTLNEEKFAIFLEEDKKINVLSPCLCSVTIGFIHKNCFNQWFNISAKKRCEICFYFYIINSFQDFYLIYLRNILMFVNCFVYIFYNWFSINLCHIFLL